MAENTFDKENISTVDNYELPSSYMVWGDEKRTYDIKENRGRWWQCPKCGGNISFDSCDEGFDEELGENQFFTIYSWNCTECGATGSVYAVVKPLYISIEQDENED